MLSASVGPKPEISLLYRQQPCLGVPDGADNRTGNPSETPTPLPLGLIKITCQRDTAPDQHLVRLFCNRKQLLPLRARGGSGKNGGEEPFITLLLVQNCELQSQGK